MYNELRTARHLLARLEDTVPRRESATGCKSVLADAWLDHEPKDGEGSSRFAAPTNVCLWQQAARICQEKG